LPLRSGRPREARIDATVRKSVLAILRDRSYRALTIDGVARRAGVPRTSIYRRWPSKQHLVADAVVTEMGVDPARDTGTLGGDLVAVAQSLRRAFSGPLGKALPALVSDMAADSELAVMVQQRVLAVRRRSMQLAFERAAGRGDITAGLDIELLLDMLTGPFYFRILFGHAPLDSRLAHTVTEYILRIAGSELPGP